MATATSKSTKMVDGKALAAKFSAMADAMQQTIDDKRRPMTQNATPKRLKEYMSRNLDGDNLERGQRALRALARAWERGEVPVVLAGLRRKVDIVSMVRHGIESSDYYDVHDSGKYAETSGPAVALQKLMEGSKTDAERAKSTERERLARIERLEHSLHGCDIPGFFPTPRPLIDLMLRQAQLKPLQTALEPSAGKGDIADALIEYGLLCSVSCCEIRPALREILEAKGHSLVGDDFLEHHGTYDRIIANPPFENMADIDHVRHAYACLNAGGRLVFLMSNSPFFRQDKKAKNFRDWLDWVGGEYWDAPADSFKGNDILGSPR